MQKEKAPQHFFGVFENKQNYQNSLSPRRTLNIKKKTSSETVEIFCLIHSVISLVYDTKILFIPLARNGKDTYCDTRENYANV